MRHNFHMDSAPRPLTHLTEEERLLQSTALDFAQKQIAPLVREMEQEGRIHPNIIRGLFELGLMGIEVPEEYGGASSSFFSAVVVIEALARVDASVSVFLDVQNTLVQNSLLRTGTHAQKLRYLPRLCQDWVGSYALSEAESGSDAFALLTRAEKTDQGYALHGSKLWITNAAESQLFIVFANVDPTLGHRGITAFLVERDAPGFLVGPKEQKLGIVASSTCPLTLDGVQVPFDQVLGEVGKGYKLAIETLNEGRIGIGAQMLGIAQAALDYSLAHVRQRKQFGQSIADFQGVQFQLAEMRTDLETARLLVYNAARLKDAGAPFLMEAAMAKLRASQVAEKLASMAVDLCGGVGFTKEYPVEKLYRDAKIGKIYEGTSNMQLLTVFKQMG